jgi:aryl-alcohol dehydrogenase-like predicted oxidoreductase
MMGGLAPEAIIAACEASLQRLGIETIDLYYQHKDDESVPLADSLGAMDGLVKSGKVRALALSQFTPERLDEAMNTAEERHLTRPCALQPWYNLVERGKLEGPLLDTATRHGMAIFPFFSLANGFLTGKYRSAGDLGKSVRGDRVAEYLDGKGIRVLAALDDVAAESGAALATIALAWTMAQPGITAPIASATSLQQLEQLTAALHLKLTPDQLRRLDHASLEAEAAPG